MLHHQYRHHRPRPIGNLLMAAITLMALGADLPIAAAGVAMDSTAIAAITPVRFAAALAQNSDDDEGTQVPSDQIEKYVAVYRDMQRDRSLNVERAAAKESLTLSEFRQLEQKIEHDDAALERARNELQAAAAKAPSATSSAAPANH
jgi:hypothetical protein